MRELRLEDQLDQFKSDAPDHPYLEDMARLGQEDQKKLASVGVDVADREAPASGTFLHSDCSTVHCDVTRPGVEMLPLAYALKKYGGLKEYYWKIMDPGRDSFTERTARRPRGGYYIRTEKGAAVTYPIRACMYISTDGLEQDVHNLVIAEEGSSLNIISGCASSPQVRSGLHVGVSEMYVKKGATLSFTMIHDWAEDMAVRPRTTVVVEEGGTYISNYICLKPARDLQMYPTVYLQGDNSVATFSTVLLAGPGSKMDTGSRVYLQGKGSRAEIVSRAVSTGGEIYARGHLIGQTAGVRAHLECDGLILSDRGLIHAIPELEARCSDLEMSHEAAVGKIDQAETEYLMSRGLTEAQAQSLIIKGFLSLDILGLPEPLKREIDKMIDQATAEGAM